MTRVVGSYPKQQKSGNTTTPFHKEFTHVLQRGGLAVRSPLDFSGVRSIRWASSREDRGRVWEDGRRRAGGVAGGRRNSGDPGSPELESIGAPFGQDTGNEKAAPPGLDGSRLLWYAMGDLRAALAGVESGPLSVP